MGIKIPVWYISLSLSISSNFFHLDAMLQCYSSVLCAVYQQSLACPTLSGTICITAGLLFTCGRTSGATSFPFTMSSTFAFANPVHSQIGRKNEEEIHPCQ